jgi:hypothetical protein
MVRSKFGRRRIECDAGPGDRRIRSGLEKALICAGNENRFCEYLRDSKRCGKCEPSPPIMVDGFLKLKGKARENKRLIILYNHLNQYFMYRHLFS